jgi:stage II sporulation protein D
MLPAHLGRSSRWLASCALWTEQMRLKVGAVGAELVDMRSRRGFPTRRASRRSRRLQVGATALACALVAGAVAAALGGFSASAAAAPAVPLSFSFSGGGLGHGLGLSQYGAQGQARSGHTASQIVTYYYTGTKVAPVTDNVDLRVDLLHMVPSFSFKSQAIAAGGGTLDVVVGTTHVAGSTKDTFSVTNAGTSLTVRRNGVIVAAGTSVAVHWSGTDSPGKAGALASELDVASTVGGLAGAGHRYRYGALLVLPHSLSGSTRMEVLNVVNLHNDYLLGIGEMPSSWPAAALQAQVIASRSYALYKYDHGVRSDCLCHLMASTADQAFVGYVKETAAYGSNWRAAVLATDSSSRTGLTAQYKGATIEAFFFAASGGRTNNSEDVWGTKIPYLRSVADPWSVDPRVDPSYAAWSPRIRTQAQVAAVFHLPNVETLDLSNRSASGWLNTVTARSTTGKKVTVSGATFVSALGLPSRWVQRTVTGVVSTDPVTAAVGVGRDLYPSARVAVLANGTSSDLFDMFLAAPFAHQIKAPLLPLAATSIPAAVRTDLVTRHVTTVYVVGSAAPAVTAALKALKVKIVQIGGTDPYATSLALSALFPRPTKSFVVVSGNDYYGLAAVAGPAVATNRPILLVRPGNPSAAFVSAVHALGASGSTIVGGETRVSAAAAKVMPAPVRVVGTPSSIEVAAIATAFSSVVQQTTISLIPPSTVGLVQAAVNAEYGSLMLMAGPRLPAPTQGWLQMHPQTVAIANSLPLSTVSALAVAAVSRA